jgi:glucosyl-dolichyl phosphate glucuronosyltransferase
MEAWVSDVTRRVLAIEYHGRLGSARNTAAEFASGDVLAFLDTAAAAAGWNGLIAPFDDERAGAVRRASLPVFEGGATPQVST